MQKSKKLTKSKAKDLRTWNVEETLDESEKEFQKVVTCLAYNITHNSTVLIHARNQTTTPTVQKIDYCIVLSWNFCFCFVFKQKQKLQISQKLIKSKANDSRTWNVEETLDESEKEFQKIVTCLVYNITRSSTIQIMNYCLIIKKNKKIQYSCFYFVIKQKQKLQKSKKLTKSKAKDSRTRNVEETLDESKPSSSTDRDELEEEKLDNRPKTSQVDEYEFDSSDEEVS